jgi:hypothetical protein
VTVLLGGGPTDIIALLHRQADSKSRCNAGTLLGSTGSPWYSRISLALPLDRLTTLDRLPVLLKAALLLPLERE